MAEKRNQVTATINGGATVNYAYTTVIPAGEKWVVKQIYLSAESLGDGLSMRFSMQFGGAPGEFITAHITSDPAVLPVEREFVGDGVKKIRMRVTNNSVTPREMSFSVDGYELG